MDELVDFFQLNLFYLLRYLLLLTVSALLTVFLLPYSTNLLIDSNLLKPNYRGESIPAATGIIFLIVLPIAIGLGFVLTIDSITTINAVLFLFVILGIGLAGLIDDCLGSHAVKGFKGHLKAFLKEKKLTTGGLKAFLGGTIALVFSIANARLNGFGKYPWIFVIDLFLVALATNIINLFDLRPGRAGKVYLIIFTVVLLLSENFIDFTGLFLPILVILLIYLPHDLKAEMMLGDVGSNLLGASLGMMMVWMLSDFGKIIAFLIFFSLQLAAEKVSFSEIIDKYGPLKYFDNLGRDKS